MAKAKRRRIYEYAKDLGLSSADLLRKLKFMGVRVDNTFNAVDAEVIEQVKRQMGLHLFEEPEEEFIDSPPIKKKAEKTAEEEAAAEAPQEQKPKDQPRKSASRPEQVVKGEVEKPKEKEPEKPQPEAVKPEPPKPSPVPESGPETESEKVEPRAARGGLEEVAVPKKEKQKKGAQHKHKKEIEDEDIRPVKKKSDEDIYTSPSKRLEAIKQKGLQKERKGTKTTFIKKRSKKDKRAAAETAEEEKPVIRKRIRVSGPMTVKELAHELGAKSSDIIMFMMKELKVMATLNQSLDLDVITLISDGFGCKVFHDVSAVEKEETELPGEVVEEKSDELFDRSPVVTVMGHVDHGKTKLLDAIRNTDVVATESGGITQHIGAYQITRGGRKITFLDTPGHEAFTQLRARGAKVTDLAVLVVAADDGVMPQTIEAIDHARDAKVPILVAINKIDKPQANPDRVRQMLSDRGLVPEQWGGDTVCVEVSAKMNMNIAELLDMIFLVTDIMELKSDPKRKAIGTVVEAKLDKGKGPVATVLVQNGTLYVGDFVVAGRTYGKLRAMENDLGERVPMASASQPVEIHGLHEVPEAGDQFFVIEDEKTAREIANKRLFKDREEKLRYESRISLEDLFKRIQQDKLKELKIILKGDVQGSIEAIVQSLENIKHEQVRVNVIRAAVGDVKETDIMLAAAANAIVVAYTVDVIPDAMTQAISEKVEVRKYDIIYKLIDDVKRAMAGMLAPEYEEVLTGKAEVRNVFSSSRVGNIAGCMVVEGEVGSGLVAKVMRGGEQVVKVKVSSLKRFKDSVKTVAQGYECGITLHSFDAFEVGDIIETYRLVEKKQETI